MSLIDETYLSKIDIAYWGNREEAAGTEMIILPSTCPKCKTIIYNFYPKFLSSDNPKYRKKLINDLIAKADCNCFQSFKNKLLKISPNIKARIKKAHNELAVEFKERI